MKQGGKQIGFRCKYVKIGTSVEVKLLEMTLVEKLRVWSENKYRNCLTCTEDDDRSIMRKSEIITDNKVRRLRPTTQATDRRKNSNKLARIP